jgi:medium-chain acyl-[acyl-carrier-protein] hydrolase
LENYFDKQFELRYSEMDKTGVSSPTTILTLLEETAADHCYSISEGLFDLEKKNIGWVLLSGAMQIDRYPGYKEKITVRTWMSDYTMVKGFRGNYIYDEQKNIIGRAKSMWVFFDIKNRRPVKIFDNIRKDWASCNEECLDQDITKKIEAIDTANHVQEFNINLFDTDMNKHVNNIRYLQWVIESIPKDIINNNYLHFIDGRFTGEAHYGDIIVSLTDEGSNAGTFDHTIKVKGDNKVCASAKTIWKKIEK